MSSAPANVTRFAIPWPDGDVNQLRGVEGTAARVATFLAARTGEVRSASIAIDGWSGVAHDAFGARSDLVTGVADSMSATMQDSSTAVRRLADELESAQQAVRTIADEVEAKHSEALRRRSAADEEGRQANAIYWLKVDSGSDEYDARYEQAYREYRWADTVADDAEAEYRSELEAGRHRAQQQVDHVIEVDQSTAAVLGYPLLGLPFSFTGLAMFGFGSGPMAAWDNLLARDAEVDAERLLEIAGPGTDSLSEVEYEELRGLLEAAALAASADPSYSEVLVARLGSDGIDTLMQQLGTLAWQHGRGVSEYPIDRAELFEHFTVPLGHALAGGLSIDDLTGLSSPRFALPLLMASGALDTEQLAWAASLALTDVDGLRDHWGMENWAILMGPQFEWDDRFSDVAVAALTTDPEAAVIALDTTIDGTKISEELLTGHWDLVFNNLTVADVFLVAMTHQMANGGEAWTGDMMERLLHEILPDGNGHDDVVLVRLVSALSALYFMPGIHDSALAAAPVGHDGAGDGLITSIRDGQIELSSKQLTDLLGMMAADEEARRLFLAGLATHQQEGIVHWISTGDDSWIEDMGALDRHWALGYEVANFRDASEQAAAINDRKKVFDFVFGLVPAPGFGSGVAAKVVGGLYSQVKGLIGTGIKDGFGSPPSTLDLGFSSQSFAQTTRQQGLVVVAQALLDADMIEIPSDFTYAAYDYTYGTSIPMGIKFHSADVLQHLGLMDDFIRWFDDLEDAGVAPTALSDYVEGWNSIEDVDT